MATDNPKLRQLSQKQRTAIGALVNGADYGEAALTAGVSNRTLYRWRGEDEMFVSELNRLSGIALGNAATKMKGHMGAAVDVLVNVMNDSDNPASARIRAALGILETGLKIIEAGELLARLEKLEAQNANY
jgi:hypothetical protein